MPVIVQAFVLCMTDEIEAAESAVYEALNSRSFESSNPIHDQAVGALRMVSVDAAYQDGGFLKFVPGANLLRTANPLTLPC